MQELQSEDLFVPAFLMKLPGDAETDRREKSRADRYENSSEDFLKGIQGWTEYFSLDECAE